MYEMTRLFIIGAKLNAKAKAQLPREPDTVRVDVHSQNSRDRVRFK